MLMKNKKAWLRIVEATIGILIVASVLFVMVSRAPKQDNLENMRKMQRFILTEVSSNETLRAEILQGQKTSTEAFIAGVKPAYWDFTTRVCEVDEVCGMPFYVSGEVYADEILIAANLTDYAPKKLKLFVWMKS